jgi:hypothetical protein
MPRHKRDGPAASRRFQLTEVVPALGAFRESDPRKRRQILRACREGGADISPELPGSAGARRAPARAWRSRPNRPPIHANCAIPDADPLLANRKGLG